MADPSSRMLRLLSLLQTHRFWLGGELADRLEVSERTLRRDVDRLRELGYPVAAARGVGGGYQLQAGAELPPLLLDDEDAIAIAIGLRTAANGSVTGMEEAAVGALTKLEQVLPPRLRRRIVALQASIEPSMRSSTPVDLDALTAIAQCVRDEERLRFGYRRRDGNEAERTVEPCRLVALGGRWYLVAWDVRRADWRTFRVDRITHPAGTGTRFAPRRPPRGDAAEYVREGISSMPTAFTAEVLVQAPAEAIGPEVGWMRGVVEPVDAATCRIRTSGDSLAWISVNLGFLRHPYVIEGPPELIAHVREDAERRLAALG
ncbi:MAG: YafY family protein [Patulibacter minatonensis]